MLQAESGLCPQRAFNTLGEWCVFDTPKSIACMVCESDFMFTSEIGSPASSGCGHALLGTQLCSADLAPESAAQGRPELLQTAPQHVPTAPSLRS